MPKLTYFTDILCGWCFGFSPIIGRLYDEYRDRLDFHVVSGGLFLDEWEKLVKTDAPNIANGTGARTFVVGVKPAGPINEVASHIKAGAYKDVEAATGVKFGKAFLDQLDDGGLVLNSLYPAMALCILREKFPEKSIGFTSSLLNAIYYDGLNSIDIAGYEPYAVKFGLDPKEFNEKMTDPTYKAEAMKDFLYYRDQPVHGFPSLMLEKDGEKTVILTSSKDFDLIRGTLDEHL